MPIILVLLLKTWDIGYFSRSVARFALAGSMHSTITNRSYLGEHFHPNLYLLYPLFKLYPSILHLAFLQIIAFLISPILLLKFCKIVLPKNSVFVYAIPFLFLVHNYISYAVLAHTQPTALSLPFIILAFYFAYKNSFFKMLITLIFLLGFKEHLAIIWISVGLFFIVEKGEWKWGIGLILSGVVIGLMVYFKVIPYFNAGALSVHNGKFQPFSLIPDKIKLLTLVLLSVGLIPLSSPKTLLYIIPAFGLSLISGFPNMMTFYFHYQDIGLIVLFVGVLFSIKSVVEQKSWIFRIPAKYHQFLLAGVFLTIMISNPEFPSRYLRENWPTPVRFQLYEEIQQYRKIAPLDCNIWADEQIGPFFIDHPNLKTFDQWSGWQNALIDDKKRVILLPRNKMDMLTDKQREKFYKQIEILTVNGIFKKQSGYSQLDIYESTNGNPL